MSTRVKTRPYVMPHDLWMVVRRNLEIEPSSVPLGFAVSADTSQQSTARYKAGRKESSCPFSILRISQTYVPLLPELGKPRRSSYALPGPDFTYGLCIRGTDGGVPEAIGHWHAMKPRPPSLRERPRNYIAMNRGALKAGYVTAREFNLYRHVKDIRCKEEDGSRFKKAPPSLPPDMTFGITARPSTPIFDLLQHRYQEVWVEQQRAAAAARQAEKKELQKKKVCETRTTLLRKHPPPVKVDSLWHLPQFQKVAPHLSTFPSRDAHKKAFSVYHSEQPTRCGPLGQGIYIKA
ncbi:cilia- and flagella-associated protein 77 isoform X1 [Alligator mississippiensis]|uniref:cilia- and flagella-associated protein 77 isoform X1 n=1 Tax=Alligator mississippiensis TaxID=8496 RepID=UPI0006EC777D|nr:cilia- and flagella-associated protein 77 isoform X1 [Alligator mississippiensis]